MKETDYDYPSYDDDDTTADEEYEELTIYDFANENAAHKSTEQINMLSTNGDIELKEFIKKQSQNPDVVARAIKKYSIKNSDNSVEKCLERMFAASNPRFRVSESEDFGTIQLTTYAYKNAINEAKKIAKNNKMAYIEEAIFAADCKDFYELNVIIVEYKGHYSDGTDWYEIEKMPYEALYDDDPYDPGY